MKMKHSIKLILMLLVTLVCVFAAVACDFIQNDDNDPTANPEDANVFEEMTVETFNVSLSSDTLGGDLDVQITNDLPGFVASDFTKINDTLKEFCFITCLDAHEECNTELENSADGEEETDLLTKLGFENIGRFYIGNGATENQCDTTQMVISSKKFASNGENCIFINVSLLGTDGASEWYSNFDVGADVEEYKTNTDEWTQKENHKGFDVTANRVYNKIGDYIKSNYLTDGNIYIVISGYSRGAAVANLTAAKIVDNDSNLTFNGNKTNVTAYTFATPLTTESENAKDEKYSVIHNFVNTQDVVTEVPPATIGFVRYGEDVKFTIADNADYLAKYKEITGSDYSVTNSDDIIGLVNSVIYSREGLYQIYKESAFAYTISADTEEELTEKANSIIEEFNAQELGDFVTFEAQGTEIVNDKECFVGNLYVSDGVILILLKNAITDISGGNYTSLLSSLSILKYTRFSSLSLTLVQTFATLPSYFKQTHYPTAYAIAILD